MIKKLFKKIVGWHWNVIDTKRVELYFWGPCYVNFYALIKPLWKSVTNVHEWLVFRFQIGFHTNLQDDELMGLQKKKK